MICHVSSHDNNKHNIMKNLKMLLIACACGTTASAEKNKNVFTMLIDKIENPPVISGRIVPETLGDTGMFWYRLQPDNQPVKPRVYDPGPIVNEVIKNTKKTINKPTTNKPVEPKPVQLQATMPVVPKQIDMIKPAPKQPMIDEREARRQQFLKTVDMEAVRQALEWQKR